VAPQATIDRCFEIGWPDVIKKLIADEGHVDYFSRGRISGWAIVEKGHAELSVEAEGRELARFFASEPRRDLGRDCGFRYEFSEPLVAAEATVRFVGGKSLPGSPFNLRANLKTPEPRERSWANNLEMPDSKLMEQSGSPTREIFIDQATRISDVVYNAIGEYFGQIKPGLRYLDFGCGVGRVAIPLVGRLQSPEFHACDVNQQVINYVKRVLPNVISERTAYWPPLPYEESSFDCVYSISIWTHLPIGMQLPWLQEIRRILRRGGLALISVSGPQVTKIRRSHEAWRDIHPQDVREQGIIYRPYPYGGLAGIDGSYGLTAHDPHWVMRVFDKIMPVLSIRPQAVEGTQDLIMLTRLE
jgi:SAM-dependent methyltransferase